MQVKLRVIGGKNDGREISISVPEFVIGRGEEAHLRPNSDLISRRHCAIQLQDGTVTVRDLSSRNGTFINGQQLTEPYVAKVGDTLRVGRLQFEVLIDPVQPGNKKPKVQGVAEAATRAASSGPDDFDEESISDWLSQLPNEAETRPLNETKQFSLEDTPSRMFVRSDEASSDEPANGELNGHSDDDKEESGKRRRKPMKLPSRPNSKADSSKSAADEVLRKFFNRR